MMRFTCQLLHMYYLCDPFKQHKIWDMYQALTVTQFIQNFTWKA